mgnify:CR=1 FL=1
MITSKNSEKKKISLSNNLQISYMFQGRQVVVGKWFKVSGLDYGKKTGIRARCEYG